MPSQLSWVHCLVYRALQQQPTFSTQAQIRADTSLTAVDVDHACADLVASGCISRTRGAYFLCEPWPEGAMKEVL